MKESKILIVLLGVVALLLAGNLLVQLPQGWARSKEEPADVCGTVVSTQGAGYAVALIGDTFYQLYFDADTTDKPVRIDWEPKVKIVQKVKLQEKH